MAFDFPSSPTTGQTYTPVAGTTYVWNGYAWNLNPPNTQGFTIVPRQFTASGTYTPTAGLLFAVVECVAGGGGGGGVAGHPSSANFWFSAGGGGSGAYSRRTLTAAQIGSSQTVTIGAGGNGGAAGYNNGSAGGDTSLGTLCVAKGGAGGGAVNSANQPTPGVGGNGALGTGDITAYGNPGGMGMYNNASNVIDSSAGFGGASFFGGGGSAQFGGGNPGTNYGGGGAGSGTNVQSQNLAGGNGSAGICVITEYVGNQPIVPAGFTMVPRVFVTTQTYTPPANLAFAQVECLGGGAAGAGLTTGSNQANSCGGGGAGAYSRRLLTAAQIGASLTITIGAGGTGTSGTGGNGSATSFGALCVANGGLGAAAQTGGSGGSVSGAVGDFVIQGQPGDSAGVTTYGQGAQPGASGGSGFFGGGAQGPPGSGNSSGFAASGYGCGGSGANVNGTGTYTGGNGSPGVCLVTEWISNQSIIGGNVSSTGAPTNGQIAVWTGATAIQGVAPEIAGASRVLLQSIDPSGTAQVDFDFVPYGSTYDCFEFVFYLQNNTGAGNSLMARYSFDGSTFNATPNGYHYAYAYSEGSGSGSSLSGAASAGMQLANTTMNGYAAQGELKIMRPWLTGIHSLDGYTSVVGASGYYGRWTIGGAQMADASPVKKIRFYWFSGGNFGAGGFFKVYGLK